MVVTSYCVCLRTNSPFVESFLGKLSGRRALVGDGLCKLGTKQENCTE
jgi:hypothetical protein